LKLLKYPKKLLIKKWVQLPAKLKAYLKIKSSSFPPLPQVKWKDFQQTANLV
jgi:hypothetical protein